MTFLVNGHCGSIFLSSWPANSTIVSTSWEPDALTAQAVVHPCAFHYIVAVIIHTEYDFSFGVDFIIPDKEYILTFFYVHQSSSQ